MLEFLFKFLIAFIVIVLYFRIVVARLGPVSRPIVKVFGLGKLYPLRDINAVVNLPLAGISLAVFCYILILITGVEIHDLMLSNFQPIFLLYGILLGIGDMALSSFFCNIAIQIAMKLAPRGPTALRDWQVIAKGGWMHYYMRTIEMAPIQIAILSIILYVSVEEIIFRGVLVNYFLPAGNAVAIAAPVLLFMIAQMFHMPNWRAAMFPIIGAFVVGIIHGSLFIAVPNIIPLIIAHLVFFIAAVI